MLHRIGLQDVLDYSGEGILSPNLVTCTSNPITILGVFEMVVPHRAVASYLQTHRLSILEEAHKISFHRVEKYNFPTTILKRLNITEGLNFMKWGTISCADKQL